MPPSLFSCGSLVFDDSWESVFLTAKQHNCRRLGFIAHGWWVEAGASPSCEKNRLVFSVVTNHFSANPLGVLNGFFGFRSSNSFSIQATLHLPVCLKNSPNLEKQRFSLDSNIRYYNCRGFSSHSAFTRCNPVTPDSECASLVCLFFLQPH